ncbi:D-amino acid aminotransferase [Legionella feeleii]|uniref:Aminodeoxychorismate lyase n=1 Tax=Legionella feeleii TaxID=453 RepID=A0A378IU15_9GAMM|nr:D-amino acid aminotransferase [Legionella feeleii]STX38440.1 D-alanine transaminase [Legionella feeleii]
MTGIVYLNGDYCKTEDAKISVFDRGFLFGDAVYEVIPVYNGHTFFVNSHLQRLESSLTQARIKMPDIDWRSIFHELIKQNGSGDLQVYLQVTRGNQGLRKHDIPEGLNPTVIAFTLHTPYPSFEAKKRGLHAMLVEDIRWSRCNIKTTSLLANILTNDDAVSVGANTAILSREGFLTEGSASNIFLVDTQGTIRTPVLDNLCLPGITRQITIDLIKSLSLPLQEEKIPIESIFNAQEVWITSTTKEIYPVTRINDCIIGKGYGGMYWQQMNEHYQQLIKNTHE